MTPRREHLDTFAISLLLGCCMFWGFQQVLIKATLPLVPPMIQACARFVGATVLLLLWCAWRRIPLWQRDGTLGAGLLAGLLFALEFVCIYVGMLYTSASRLTILLYTSPLWVALLLPVWLKHERLHAAQWLGLSLAFAGVAFALRDSLTGVSSLQGDLLSLTAGAMWGLTTVVLRTTALARVRAEKLLIYQIGVSALLLPLVAWPTPAVLTIGNGTEPESLDPQKASSVSATRSVPTAMPASRRTASRFTPGATSLSNSSHLLTMVGSMIMKPVALPPGRARLLTKPLPTGSATITKITGTVRVWISKRFGSTRTAARISAIVVISQCEA